MRYATIFAKGAVLFLLLVLATVGEQACAQNQTPANAPPPVGWIDPDTGLTWTKADNGSDINWNDAKAYCSNLRLGGYTDWRLPTIDELQSIYDPGIDVLGYLPDVAVTWYVHVKGNLKLVNVQWSSTQKNAREPLIFDFVTGKRSSYLLGTRYVEHALCVRRSRE